MLESLLETLRIIVVHTGIIVLPIIVIEAAYQAWFRYGPVVISQAKYAIGYMLLFFEEVLRYIEATGNER